MAHRLPSFLPRIAVLVLVALGATAGLTFAAGSQVPSAPAVPTVAATPSPPLVVPDVRNQAFVFAKGTLGDAGFAWRVAGSVRGFAANVVVAQTPAAGTRIVDTGAPLITLTLKRNSSYPQSGEAADTSPYPGTVVQAADLAGNALGPAAPATETGAPAATVPKAAAAPPAAAKAPATPAKTATTATKPTTVKSTAAATWPQSRPTAFDVPGARKEPLDEMPLPDRAKALASWLEAHPAKTAANAKYWLYQNAWIVAGAKFGWWRGAEALQTLIAVDHRAEKLWGIGAKSVAVAEQTLSEVKAHST
jgi:hypothetical protein